MYLEVKNKLVSVLTSLSGVGQPLQAVYGYFPPEPKAYPCAMVRLNNASTETRLDTISNMQSVAFEIRILIRTSSSEQDENDRISMIETVLNALRTSLCVDTLGGIVDKFDIGDVMPFDTINEQPVTGMRINVIASIRKFIT